MRASRRVVSSVAAGLSTLAALAGVARAATAPAAPPPNSAVVAPDGVVGHAGRWLVDAQGRVVIVHGVNVPTKTTPATPAAMKFDDDDAVLLRSSGMNAVRLTVERYKVEPAPGRFDDAYVRSMSDTVAMLARHGLMSLIDFHQDEWGPEFYDNGFPSWMTMTDGLPNLYEVGFPGQYLVNPALNRAFDHFWADDVGPDGHHLQDDDAGILAHVVKSMAGASGLLGYEIMNEPWAGSQWPSCAVPGTGCPVFDQGAYSAYYAKVIRQLRAADPHHLIWYEPQQTFNEGAPTSMTVPRDPGLGFAFHDYTLCDVPGDQVASASGTAALGGACGTNDTLVLRNAEAHGAATGSALLNTEFGATPDPGRVARQLATFDQHLMPWMFWSYTSYVVPYAKDGTLRPANDANVNRAMLAALARPYPQVVAGTPTGWSFDPTSKTFNLAYTRNRADGRGLFAPGAETDIAVPAIQYPTGYVAAVTSAIVTSQPDAPVLRVRPRGTDPVTVTVTPRLAVPAPPRCGPAGPGRYAACVGGTRVLDGSVEAGYDPGTGEGYAVEDGGRSNPSLLAGYLGVDTQHILTVVACAGGDYDPDALDDWNQSPQSSQNNASAAVGTPTFTAPSGPVGPSSPCSPPLLPAPTPGPSCGSPPDPAPRTVVPGHGSPLNAYTSGGAAGSTGVAGNFGGNDGASGYLQLTTDGSGHGNVTTGGTSKGGGGTVAVGNDGNETKDRWTDPGSPVALCQD